MEKILTIKEAEYLGDYKIKLRFNNGDLKLVDLASHISGEIFKPLSQKKYFKNFNLHKDLETICWENGADFAPEFLHKIGTHLN